jgi:hypothetical protein
MGAIARNLDLSLGVFAALAAVRLVGAHHAPASRMGALCWFDCCHESVLSAGLNYGSAAAYQVEHQHYQSDHQEQVDQASADAHAKS